MSNTWMALGAGALAGGLSIPHCIAMCGPLAVFAAGEKPSPSRIARYQLGRLGAYAVLGAVAGSSGGALASFVTPRWAAVLLSGLVAAAMVLAAVRLLRRPTRDATLVSLGKKRRRAPLVARVLARVPREPTAFGALTALLPCGALYSAVLVAAGMGAWQAGALAMSAFASTSGLGLASSAILGQRAQVSPRGRRVLAAALLVGAVVLVARPIVVTPEQPACHGTAAPLAF